MAVVLTPVKSAPTTTPPETHVPVDYALNESVLVYRPEDNSFIALYGDEWLACRAEGLANMTAIEELQDANRTVTEKSLLLRDLLQEPNPAKADIAKARKDLDAALATLAQKSEAAKKRIEAITDQKTDPNKLVELLPLTKKRIGGETHTPIYVNAQRLKNALQDKRVYLVEGSTERKKAPKDKLFNGTSLNANEVRKRILDRAQDNAKLKKKWKLAPEDAEAFSGIFTDWAKVMGGSVTTFLEREQRQILEGVVGADKCDPNNPYRTIDMKPEAQFMRWSAGAGAEANFTGFQGSLNDKRDKTMGQRFRRAAKSAQFGIKANAEASFAVGEAKVETILYVPHAAGWHLDTAVVGQPLDFGYFRLRGDLTLYALAGASIALEADAALMVTGDKQGLKGTPKNQPGAKAKVGAKGEVKVFAGLKEGIGLAGALQWLNPEGFINPSAPRRADVNKVIAAYVDVAGVTTDVSAIEGLAATLGFECDYRGGNFVIAAKAGGCLGLGGSGSVAGKVGVEQIAQFFMCIAHQLKHADYKKLKQMMKEEAFHTLNRIFYLVVANDQKFESFVGKEIGEITTAYERAGIRLRQIGEQSVHEIAQQLRTGWGWYAYMPPESRGALIKSIIDSASQPNTFVNDSLRKLAAFSINELLFTVQSTGHLYNTLDRITLVIGEVPGRNYGVKLINSILEGTIFADCVSRCELQLARAKPLVGRPFLRNDDADFRIAEFALHHPGYVA